MRISDWSSDVCSSDLESRGGSGHLETLQLLRTTTGDIRSKFEIETNDGRHQPVRSPGKSRPILLLLCINRTAMMRVTTSLTDDGGTFSKDAAGRRSEEHTSELQSLMRISYAVFCLKNKNTHTRK